MPKRNQFSSGRLSVLESPHWFFSPSTWTSRCNGACFWQMSLLIKSRKLFSSIHASAQLLGSGSLPKIVLFFPVGLSCLPRLRNAFIPSASMTAVRRNCKLKTDRDRRGGVGANLWSWVLFGDRSWSVTCSRCCWWSWQGLAPDPQTTAACKQEGQSWHSCTSRSNSWRMSRATSGLHTSTVYASAACLNQQGTVSSIIILKKHDNYPKTS